MNTVLTLIIVILSSIGMAVSMHFIMDTIFKAVDAQKEHRKKQLDDLEKIIERLDEIIRILRTR